MNIYVCNLAHEVTQEDLEELFSEYGTVETVNIIKDRFSGMSKGYGFVDMPDNSEADKAMKALNGIEFKDNRIKISQAENRRKRSSRRKR